MRLFLDTSVLLAASGSASGASRHLFRLAHANSTLDKSDFGALLDSEFYGLPILTPGAFLGRERSAGRLSDL